MTAGADSRVRVRGGQAVVELHGELDTAGAAAAEAVVVAGAAGGRCVIVDLAALEFIDSAALGALVHARKLARQAGGDVQLAAPQGPVRQVLALTGLDEAFGVHASVASAARAGPPLRPGTSHL
jgi:anti-sigma B factor antagonist